MLEEMDGVVMIGRAGHDVPGQGSRIFLLVSQNCLGEVLEERLVSERREAVGSLRCIETQSGSLTARHGEACDLAILQ